MWDRLDKIGRWQSADKRREAEHKTKVSWETHELENHKADQPRPYTIEDFVSGRAEQEPHSNEPVPENRKPTREEFMAKLDADERELIANERKRAKELLDGIEAKQKRDPSFVPNGTAFAKEIEKQSINLNSDERFRARQLGIEHECVGRRGLSRGF